MIDKEWIFRKYCSPNCKIGVFLRHELGNIDDNLEVEDKRRLALENLGKTIGCEIKANDFLALGPRQYLELRKDVKTAIIKRIDRLSKKAEK